MYGKNLYNIVISLQLIKINEKKKRIKGSSENEVEVVYSGIRRADRASSPVSLCLDLCRGPQLINCHFYTHQRAGDLNPHHRAVISSHHILVTKKGI